MCQVSHVFFSNHKSDFLQNLHNSSVSWKITPLYVCSSNNISLVTRSQLKNTFFRLSSAWIQIREVPLSISKQQVSSSSIFVPHLIVMAHNSSLNFKLIHFLLLTKGSHQSSNFYTFECSGEILPNSSCYFASNKSVFLQVLHHSSKSWEITPLYLFSWNNVYSAQKRPIKVKLFETFECSCQNLSNSLCQYWNDQSILSKFCVPLHFHER